MDPTIAEKILNFQPFDKESNPLFWITRLGGGIGGVDRTNKLNKFKSDYTPIPTDIGNFNKSFSDVCFEEAQKLWKDNDFIEVSWSGGIDSTSVALALLETKPESKKLQLTCSSHSITEYPKFYETHKDICNLISVEEYFSKEHAQSEHLIVTGDVGDQLWGINWINWDDKDLPWEAMLDLPDVFRQSHGTYPEAYKEPWSQGQKNKFADLINDHATACPFEIKTIFDMGWWLNFSTRVNYVGYRIKMIIAHNHKLNHINLNNLKPFYLTDDFQRWSLTNHNKKSGSVKTTYKQPAKDFIFSLHKDADYAKNKTQEPSLPKMIGGPWYGKHHHDINANYAVMSNGTIYSTRNDMPVSVIEDIMGKN